jgi:hypothetical protein
MIDLEKFLQEEMELVFPKKKENNYIILNPHGLKLSKLEIEDPLKGQPRRILAYN